jgi:acyl carrier protein
MADGGRVPQSEFTSDSKLRSQLGFDSFELAVLTVRIEAEFGVDVFADGVVETVGEIERKILSGSREE